MRLPIYILSLALLSNICYGQTTIQTKEVKIKYTNGNEIFKICSSGCVTNFEETKEYFWYTEFSKIKSTEGGSGGSLLHGNYKFYDENGNLRRERNYYLGLLDGTEKNWDSLGNIVSIIKYNKSKKVYDKHQNDEKIWVENIGPLFEQGTVTKFYNQYNLLVLEKTFLDNLKVHYKEYYEYSGKLSSEYTSYFTADGSMTGKYMAYFENGKVQTIGQFYDGDFTNIKVGTWQYFNSDGTLNTTEQHKVSIEKWGNGKLKIAGGYIYDADKAMWLKTGEWRPYTEDGIPQAVKKFQRGIEVTE